MNAYEIKTFSGTSTIPKKQLVFAEFGKKVSGSSCSICFYCLRHAAKKEQIMDVLRHWLRCSFPTSNKNLRRLTAERGKRIMPRRKFNIRAYPSLQPVILSRKVSVADN